MANGLRIFAWGWTGLVILVNLARRRAAKLSPVRREEIARKAARVRWGRNKKAEA